MLYATTHDAPVFGLRRQINWLFENAFGRSQAGLNAWTPAVDIHETDQDLTFAVELPGIELEDIEVTAADGILTIRGKRNEELTNGQDGQYYLVERNYGSFVRRFQLPQGVDTEKIVADMQNGMLQVHIPKAALPQPKNIRITSGADVSRNAPRALGRVESRQDSSKKLAGATQSK
jgi:HSP20 family protein